MCVHVVETYADQISISISVTAAGNQMVPLCAEWRCETDSWATTPIIYCSSTASLPFRPHCANARRIRCQADLISFPRRTRGDHQDVPVVRELRLFSRTWNQWSEPVHERSNRRGSESSTLEIDVYIWRYALLLVHARNERTISVTTFWIVTMLFFGNKWQLYCLYGILTLTLGRGVFQQHDNLFHFIYNVSVQILHLPCINVWLQSPVNLMSFEWCKFRPSNISSHESFSLKVPSTAMTLHWKSFLADFALSFQYTTSWFQLS